MATMARVMPVKIEGDAPEGQEKSSTVFFEVVDVEVTGTAGGWEDVAAGSEVPAEEAGASLARAVDVVKPIAARIVDGFRSLGDAAPEEIEITLGVKLSGKVGFFIAESEGEASIGLKLKWKAS